MLELIKDYFISTGFDPRLAHSVTVLCAVMGTGALGIALKYLTQKVLNANLLKLLSKLQYTWVTPLKQNKILSKVAHIVPGILFYLVAPKIADFGRIGATFSTAVGTLSALYLIAVFTILISGILDVVTDTYERYEVSKKTPIRSYTQVIKLASFLIATVISFAIILNKDPLVLLTGLGAAAALLVVVFKDQILGFIASIQISMYDVVRIGDWITVPSYNTDGDVEEISLTTVKIRNFDKTISTIPTSSLLTSGVKNWRGMQEAGGRRIKRSINIDMNTVKFCSEDMLDRFSKIDSLKADLDKRWNEIGAYNRETVENHEIPVNGRMLTNLGIFRMYVNKYLENNEHIHKNGFTFLVRQLQPTETGIPLELYIFTNDTNWTNYESIQSDIFDHLIAALPIFELKVFQNITGNELPQVIKLNKAPGKPKSVKKAS